MAGYGLQSCIYFNQIPNLISNIIRAFVTAARSLC